MKTTASTHDQTDGRLVMIGVVVADLRWSCNDGGKSHGGLGMSMEMTCFRLRDCWTNRKHVWCKGVRYVGNAAVQQTCEMRRRELIWGDDRTRRKLHVGMDQRGCMGDQTNHVYGMY